MTRPGLQHGSAPGLSDPPWAEHLLSGLTGHRKARWEIAEFLENHPKVRLGQVSGLKSHPQYEPGIETNVRPGAMISLN